MRLIDTLIEPNRLLVIWQAPDKVLNQATGRRFIVGEIFGGNKNATLRYYDNQDTREAVTLGFTGLTAYPYEPGKEYISNLTEVLSKRLPPTSRSDYNDYLTSYRIAPTAEGISALSLLAYTTGKLAGDGFTFSHTFEGIDTPFDFTFEIAGFRYHEGMKIHPLMSLQDVEVTFERDNSNSYDQDAVAVEYKKTRLGHVPKGLNKVLCHVIGKKEVHAFVEKINGTPERPKVLVYVSVR
jgi:hypothetical protein